jgi:hypothetical protein
MLPLTKYQTREVWCRGGLVKLRVDVETANKAVAAGAEKDGDADKQNNRRADSSCYEAVPSATRAKVSRVRPHPSGASMPLRSSSAPSP